MRNKDIQGTVDMSLAKFDEIAGGSGCHVVKPCDTPRRGGSARPGVQ